jgi:hypothetical protein
MTGEKSLFLFQQDMGANVIQAGLADIDTQQANAFLLEFYSPIEII